MADSGNTFVSKTMDLSNSPELRPVERYWAQTKAHLREDGRFSKTVDEFKKFYLYNFTKLAAQIAQHSM